MKKYIIKLSSEERGQLNTITKKGRHNAQVIKRARVLFESDTGDTDAVIANQERASTRTVQRIRKRYHEGGLGRALYDAPRPGTPPVLNDRQEAHLIAIACSNPPEGHTHWTMELLRERMINNKIVDRVSVGTIHARLTEQGVKPWREKNVVSAKDYQAVSRTNGRSS